MPCKIVWDGKEFSVPEELGKPREDQLQGSNLDKLVELSGRTCYRSLGRGRPSADYHKHIIEVGHLSVIEHANLTFELRNLEVPEYLSICEVLLNRPGIWATKIAPSVLLPNRTFTIRLTTNLRAIREWFKYPKANKWAEIVGASLQYLAKKESPLVMGDIENTHIGVPFEVVEPNLDEEIWLSFYIYNVSRALSHEIVRHGDFTGISQLSSRYVSEDDSPWIWHPLLNKWAKETTTGSTHFEINRQECNQTYKYLVDQLEKYLVSKGVDKFTARKQSRGAARGVLGNALATELIFSASLSQWKHMILLRAHSAADAEIRQLFNQVFEVLSKKYPERFENFTTKPADDGFGLQIELKKSSPRSGSA